MNVINWNELTDAYNGMHGTDFTEPEMLKHLYFKFRSLTRAAATLGVSMPTFRTRYDALGLDRAHYHKSGDVKKTLLALPDHVIKDMTSHEIAECVGCHRGTVYECYRVAGREYRRQRRPNRIGVCR
jgi:hypothetical protein